MLDPIDERHRPVASDEPVPVPRTPVLIELAPTSRAEIVAVTHLDPDAPARSRTDYLSAKRLCCHEYAERYPDYAIGVEEVHDRHACVLFGRDATTGRVAGTLRVCFDTGAGLPLEPSLGPEVETLRRCGLRLAEPRRFVIRDPGAAVTAPFRAYLSAIYQIAKLHDIDVYLMQVRTGRAGFYRRVCAAADLDSGRAADGCVNLAWNLRRTPRRFFRAFGADQSALERYLRTRGAGR